MKNATYSLALIKKLMAMRRWVITGSSQRSAAAMGLDEQDIVDCILALHENCFYKTMPAELRPGTWQDVYRPRFAGLDLYVKVQVVGTSPDDTVVVISFKRSTTVPPGTRAHP